MKKLLMLLLAALFVVGMVSGAMASPLSKIEYTASSLGSGKYQLSFDVYNNALSNNIDWFIVFFGQTPDGMNFTGWDAFSNLSPGSVPGNWSASCLQPSSLFDMPGQFTSQLSSGTGITPGSHDQFKVSFDMTGSGNYDHLYYMVGNLVKDNAGNVIDFPILEDGYTEAANAEPQPIPIPAGIILLGSGVAGLGIFKGKKKIA